MGIAEREKYQSDYDFAIQLNRWLLKPLGMWPMSPKDSKSQRLLSSVYIVFCSFCLAFLTIPGCLRIIEAKGFQKKLRIVGPLSFCAQNTIKYGFYMLRRKKIGVCLEKMLVHWHEIDNEEDHTIMMTNVRKARYFMSICAAFMFGGGFPFSTVFPLLSKTVRPEDNATIRDLAFPAYFITFDAHVRPFYDYVYSLQFLSCTVMCSITCAVCSITILFVLHICGQLTIVMALLNDLVQGKRRKFEKTDERLAYILEKHLKALRFASDLEKIFSEICLLEFLGSTLNICLLGYYSITLLEKNETNDFYVCLTLVTYILLFTSYLFNMFIFCYISEMLIEQCEKVGAVTYMIEWHALPAKTARNLILIIIISHRPAKLSAGNMIIFSIACFCGVVKASMAYLNFLHTFFT